MTRVAVLGAGGWGTALASLLAGNGKATVLWARRPDLIQELRQTSENRAYLPGVALPACLGLTSDLAEAVAEATAIVLAVPAQTLRDTLTGLAPVLEHPPLLISCAKGLERQSHLRMSEVVSQVLPPSAHRGIVALSGPNHAEEVGRRIPSATVVASSDPVAAREAQELCMTRFFRVYTNNDVLGVELGGALKNVIALAAGISDGLGFGDNTKAALITRGLAEMTRLATALGASPLTLAGLAGMGDLIVTCTSRHSRNRRAGEELGRGRSLQDVLDSSRMVVEGVFTTSAAVELADSCGVELPIARAVRGILFDGTNPLTAVAELMERDPRGEEA